MLASSTSSLAKRSGLMSCAAAAASRLGLLDATTVVDQQSLSGNSVDERMFSSMGSSTSSTLSSPSSSSTAAAGLLSTSTSTSSSSPLVFFSSRRSSSSSSSWNRDIAASLNRGFSSSAIDDSGTSTTSSSSSSSNDNNNKNNDNDNWSNPMPSLEAIDDFLDEWGRLLDEGDAAGVLKLLEEKTKNVPGLPPLSEVWASATAADDERAARRAHETAAQLEAASRRQRLVDEQGRSYATGRRKEAVARVWLRPAGAGSSKKSTTTTEGGGGGGKTDDAPSTTKPVVGRVWINGAPLDAYFPSAPTSRAADVLAPFVVTRTVGDFDVRATVRGGGPTGQAQAVRHGVARALQLWDPETRPALKAAGLLTRDSRSVERKKPGRAKARKAFQWVKR